MAGIIEKAQETFGRAAVDAGKMMQDIGESEKIKQLNTSKKDPNKGGHLTTNLGTGVDDTDVWLKVAGEKQGPALLEDHHAREKVIVLYDYCWWQIHHFDHERIPERVVHARGAGAHGVFRLKEAIPELSCADIFNDTSHETPLFVRFSTVLGSRGSADTVRDVRGFAMKFYTREGNWDLVGNNIPVFFIQDAIKFPDVIHAGTISSQVVLTFR
jgi:catalase